MTLAYAKHTNYWFNFEKNVKDYLYSYRDKKTGVHVHVPRHLFSKYQIGLIGQFLNLKANYDYQSIFSPLCSLLSLLHFLILPF